MYVDYEDMIDRRLVVGKRILFALMGWWLLNAAAVIVYYNIHVGSHKLGTQIIRFVLTLLLCYWLYRGSKAAKWITVVLLFIAIVLADNLLDIPEAIGSLIWFIMVSHYVMCTLLIMALVGSKSVNAYLTYQRTGRIPG